MALFRCFSVCSRAHTHEQAVALYYSRRFTEAMDSFLHSVDALNNLPLGATADVLYRKEHKGAAALCAKDDKSKEGKEGKAGKEGEDTGADEKSKSNETKHDSTGPVPGSVSAPEYKSKAEKDKDLDALKRGLLGCQLKLLADLKQVRTAFPSFRSDAKPSSVPGTSLNMACCGRFLGRPEEACVCALFRDRGVRGRLRLRVFCFVVCLSFVCS